MAWDATKYTPPNISKFDGAANGSSTLSQLCGCMGSSLQANSAPTPSTSTNQVIQLMMAFFAAQAKNPTLVPPIPTTTDIIHASPIVLQPLPSPSQEMETFLVDLLQLKGIDITSCQVALKGLTIIPDVIPDMSIVWTITLTGLLEGQVVKLQRFAEEWSKTLAHRIIYLYISFVVSIIVCQLIAYQTFTYLPSYVPITCTPPSQGGCADIMYKLIYSS